MQSTLLRDIHRLQGRFIREHYQRALEAQASGRKVAYVTAMFPVEIVKAFEPALAAVYPENHAALLIARGMDGLVSRAEAAGLDRMGCAYELFNTGYLLEGWGGMDAKDLLDDRGRPLPRLPEPDILLPCDNQCRVVCEWFKHLSELHRDAAYKMINVGDRYDGSLDHWRQGYVRAQLEELIAFLEEQTGTRLDRDRLLEVAESSRQALELWNRYLDLGTRTPSPVTAFDGFSHMALIVAERGRAEAVAYYRELIEATEKTSAQGGTPVEPQRHRLLWDNLATWYNFRELQAYFAGHGIAVVGSTYLDAWRKKLDTSSYDALLDSMARTYSAMYTNMTIGEREETWKRAVEKYDADGILFHKNLSCHTFSLRVDQIAAKLKNHFGEDFRTVVFEGCQGIRGRFQKHAFETGITVNFVER